MAERARLLILGGTAEAVALARVAAPDFAVTYSLAGRTQSPSLPAGVTVRSGGFGGAAALGGWIADNGIDAVVDATHPFAARIARNAAAACAQTGTPRLKLLRPAWERQTGDRWHTADDPTAAAALLPGLGSRAFLSLGTRDLEAFDGLAGMAFLVRTIEPLAAPPLANATCVTGRGPFTVADETALLRAHAIDAVVSRNSGGAATYAKIAAARALSLPVVMIARPAPPAGAIADTAESAVDWLGETLGEMRR